MRKLLQLFYLRSVMLVLLLGTIFNTAKSQTTLAAGDIAIIGTNYDASPYEMTIVNLVPISAGTVIRITDYGYDEATSTFGTTSVANTAEGSITWTLTSAIPAGTVTKFLISGGATPSVSISPNTGSVSLIGWSLTNPASCPVPAGGDNWFIFQGSSPTSVTTFIFAWTNTFATTFNGINQPAGQFLVPGSGLQPGNNNSYLPPSLTLGSTAIALNRDPASGGYHGDNNVYNGLKTGTKAAILADICNVTKWSTNETTAYDISPGGTSFSGTNPIFKIGVLLNSSPTLTFTSNSTEITSDDIASDGEGGSQTISDIDIQIYNISNSNGTLLPALSWQDNSFMGSSSSSYSGLTNENNAGSKGMAIKSASGSEFRLNQFIYYNWGETSSFTNTVKGYKDGSEVASTTFNGFDPGYTPKTITLTSAFQNVDEVRFYITAGGYKGDQSATNHSINSFALASPVVATNTAPTDIALSATSINENVIANSAVGTLSSTDADASNTFTYSLVAGTGSTDNSAFTITGNSLTINASPDFETKSSYSVRIRTTDQGGLSFEKVFAVTVNNLCDIVLTAASQTNIACNGGSTGAATVNAATGGTGPYSYNWTPGTPTGDGTVSVTGLTPGVWTCTVSDNAGCSTTRDFTITQPTAISTATAAQTNVSCNGGSNGSASVTPSGGAGGYTYSWSPSGGTAATTTGRTAGTYTVTVTDANGCTATRNFTITQPTTISTATAAQTNVSCNGGSNGSASVTPSGGAGGYTYSWSPSGGTAATATGLSAGTYTVTVTDANGCTATRNFTITQPTTISTATAAQTNVSCNGGSNGSASVTPSGGAGGYTYSWSPSGGTAATTTGRAAGTYTVTVTDANGCTATRNFTITQPTTISTATAAQTNVSCNGGSNGSASVTPSGGAGGYTYSWSPSGGTAATATGLSAGTYTVTVTDANACTATRNFTITQPTTISTATAAQTNVSCNGGSNGSASVTPSGGAGGYTYSWSPSGGTAATTTGRTAGTYTVTVTDANGCTATRNFTITQPTTISTATAAQTNVSCNGGSNGSASVTPSGGAGGYTYSWSPSGGTAATATGLSAGTYTVTVTDANGCTATRNFTITQPTVISTATASQTNVSTSGGSNGSASVTPSGGAGGYTYSWSPSGGTASTATGLTAGTYTVTVTDANGCTATRNFTITQPTTISTATGSQTNVSCNGGSNGSASVTPSGGAGGYTYSWSPSGGTAATATGLSAGTYTVTVTDANSNTATRNFTITQPTAISTATAAQTNVSCNGGSNGSASVTPSGGAGGYSYSWSPSGGTAATATGLSAGTYTVTVTDANFCTATRNFTITQPTTISTATAAQTNVSCNGGSNGSASVTPSGGAGGYSYSWSPSGGTAATATGLSAGTYTVTVTDANGCTATRNFTITQPTAISTATAAQTNVSCNGGSNGSASVTPSGGAGGYTYSWSPSGGTAATATGLSAGTYTVTVTDANGCTATRNFTITQPTTISTATAAQTNVSCNGGSNGSASVTPSGGAGGYTYSWSPSGGTAATATGLSAGTYTVTVTDANGCTATRNFTITQPTVISTATASQTNVSTSGGSNGSASVTPSGGAGGYTYSWSPSGGTAATATGLTAGTYTVTVTDANGCTATRNFTITQPTTISTATGSQTNVSCNGGSNGSASVTPSGGAGGYTYSWSPSGGTAATATGLSAGTYTVTVTDANSNTATRNFTITQPTTISTATAAQTNVSCNGGSNGSASVTPSGGAGGYTYSWSPSGGTAATATGLSAGTYTVTVTDANGCTATRNFTITQPTTISTATAAQTNVSCNGGSNGSASVTPSGGAGGYSYSWSPSGGTAATATGLSAGTYTVTVTDANGCTATRNFTITQPTAISTATAAQTNVSCNGGSNGSASVTPSGGAGGYTYSWSPSGGTAATATGLSAGTYTVTVTDANACTATRNFTIIVLDTVKPVVVTQNRTIYLNSAGTASVSALQVNNGSSDACGVASLSLSKTSFNCNDTGANLVTLTVTDVNNNSQTANATITVLDTIKPVVNVQNGIVLYLNQTGSINITPNQFNSGSTDNCGIKTVSVSPTNITCADIGIKTILLTVTDNSGNVQTGTTTAVVLDPIAPIARPKQSVSVYLSANGQAVINPSLMDSASTDNCNITARLLSQSVFNCSNIGANNVLFTVQDQSGNANSANIIVTVFDTVRPIATISNQNIYLNSNGTASITASQVNNNSTDNCGVATVAINKSTFSCADLGSSNIIFTATDINGNNRTANVNVNVFDSIRPIVRPRTNVLVYLNSTGTGSITLSNVDSASSDNCSIASRTLSQTNFTCANLGNNIVTLTALDVTGNEGSRNFNVTVIDTIKPLITAQAANIYLNSNGVASLSTSQVVTSSSDNCSNASISLSQTNFTCANLGSNTVNITATDASGNFRTIPTTVTVIDSIKPILNVQNRTIYLNASGTASLTATQVNNGSTDNCGIQTTTISKTNFLATDLGLNTISFTATDASGNSQTSNVLITVIDTVRPIAITQNRTIYLNTTGNATVTANQVNNGSTDNSVSTTLQLSKTAFTCSDLGTNQVLLTVSDGSNNSTSASATITVLDTIKPNVVAQNLNVYLNGLGLATITPQQVNNGSTDNCAISNLSLSKTNFGCSDRGASNITFTATDASGNFTTANVTVTIIDTIKPNIVVNNNLNLYLNASGTVSLTTAQVNNGSTDNCGITNLSLSKTSFNGTNLGLNTITFTATDASTNSQSVTLNVIVIDTVKPIVNAIGKTIYLNNSGSATLTASEVNNGSTDNVAIGNISINKTTFNCNDVGDNSVQFTATDLSGNSSSTLVNISVVDTILPVVTFMPSNIRLGHCGAGYRYTLPTVTDNCGDVKIVQTEGIALGNTYPVGTTTNIFTFTDKSGNKVTRSFTVTILPSYLPDTYSNIVVCSDVETFDLTKGKSNIVFTGSGVTLDGKSFDPALSGSGNYNVTYVFTDSMNCETKGNFFVTVNRSPEKPIISRQNANVLEVFQQFNSYQWLRYGQPLANGNQKSYTMVIAGLYSVRVGTAQGCFTESDALPVGVNVGVNEGKNQVAFKMYPNPSTGKLYFEIENATEQTTAIIIYDALGKLVYESTTNSFITQLDLSNLADGNYFVRLNQGDKTTIKPMVLTK